MVAEGGVNVRTLVVLLLLFRVLSDELLLAEGGCPRRNGGRSTGVGWVDGGDLDDERILRQRQDKPKVAILDPSAGNLNRHCVHGEETMGVLNGCIFRFPRLIGEGWEREEGDDGFEQ